MQEDIRGFVNGLSRGVLVEKELFIMVFGILLAGCVIPSANSQEIASQTAIIPPSSTVPAEPASAPSHEPRNLSNFRVAIPPCTSEQVQVAFDAYACNTSFPITFTNILNSSDSFDAWGATTTFTESTMVNFTQVSTRTFYNIFISDNITSEKWSKDTIYSRVLAHELCHVEQNRQNRPSSEEECDRLAGWGI